MKFDPTKTTVVFDLGGVLVRICHTWQEAVKVAQIPAPRLIGSSTGLGEAPSFEAYQAGQISLEDYLADLSNFLGCNQEQALLAHDGILKDQYPGVDKLVDHLIDNGHATGCLSNTNAPHWEVLIGDQRFETIKNLTHRMASHEVGLSKPDPAIFNLYSAQFGLVAAQILYFDDNVPNVKAARELGWNAHVIDPAGDTAAQMTKIVVQLLG